MRGRRRSTIKIPRARRQKISLDGKRRVFAPWCKRVGVVIEAGPEQSMIRWLDDRSEDHFPQEGFYPNDWFRSERVRLKEQRVRLKLERVKLKTERVRL